MSPKATDPEPPETTRKGSMPEREMMHMAEELEV